VIKEKVSWKELESLPEIIRVGDRVNFLIPLTIDEQKANYCFTFVTEEGRWFLQHLESITIRLDKVPHLPASTFPDLPEAQKAWIREELRTTELVRLFSFLSREKGKDFALSWFKDGEGYFLAAKAWVPFVAAPKAFILFVCWEQTNLRGNAVTLEKMGDDECVLRMRSIYLDLYERAGHLKKQISLSDYRRIFETVWQDRSDKAGWKLQITYEREECLFKFRRI
jgi:hypothetical protein